MTSKGDFPEAGERCDSPDAVAHPGKSTTHEASANGSKAYLECEGTLTELKHTLATLLSLRKSMGEQVLAVVDC